MRNTRQSLGGLGNMMFLKAYVIGKMLDGEIPDVYVQGEKYWAKHKGTIREYFSDGITKRPEVALHIRRGDYLKADHFHVDLSKTDYYQKAVKMFLSDTPFLVFCKDNQGRDQEDRDWCTEFLSKNFPKMVWEFAPINNSETEDMNMMAGCSSLIGANSSFSWWAAYIGSHERSIFPRQWFVDEIQRTELLPEWTLL